jgi:ribosome-associated toxin RatA of RatAB toxin-antitoxin module
MPVVEKSALVEYLPAQLFALVERIEDYPAFLPWCAGAEVHRRDEHITVATIHVNYHGIKFHFSTENDKQPVAMMTMKLRDGPFQRMAGEWRFIALGDQACKVQCRLDYEFSSALLGKTLGPVFNHIAGTFVDSFIKRARQIHGAG